MPGRARVGKKNLTLQQEKFCLEFFKNGGNGEEAYRLSYAANAKRNAGWVRLEAHKLLKNKKIAARVAELQAELREETQYDARAANRDFKKAFDLANTQKQPAAMVAAARARAELNGLIVRKSDVTNRSVSQLSPEEIEKAMNDAAREAGFVIQRVSEGAKGK